MPAAAPAAPPTTGDATAPDASATSPPTVPKLYAAVCAASSAAADPIAPASSAVSAGAAAAPRPPLATVAANISAGTAYGLACKLLNAFAGFVSVVDMSLGMLLMSFTTPLAASERL